MLERKGLIQAERSNKVARFYPIRIRGLASIVLKECRNKTRKTVIDYLMLNNRATLDDLVAYTHKSRSTISWHMKHLYKDGLIDIEKDNKNLLYSLKYRAKIADILRRYYFCFINR